MLELLKILWYILFNFYNILLYFFPLSTTFISSCMVSLLNFSLTALWHAACSCTMWHHLTANGNAAAILNLPRRVADALLPGNRVRSSSSTRHATRGRPTQRDGKRAGGEGGGNVWAAILRLQPQLANRTKVKCRRPPRWALGVACGKAECRRIREILQWSGHAKYLKYGII